MEMLRAKTKMGSLRKSLICSRTVCRVPSGGLTDKALKRQETSAEKQTPALYLGTVLLSGNENMHVHICSVNPYADS